MLFDRLSALASHHSIIYVSAKATAAFQSALGSRKKCTNSLRKRFIERKNVSSRLIDFPVPRKYVECSTIQLIVFQVAVFFLQMATNRRLVPNIMVFHLFSRKKMFFKVRIATGDDASISLMGRMVGHSHAGCREYITDIHEASTQTGPSSN